MTSLDFPMTHTKRSLTPIVCKQSCVKLQGLQAFYPSVLTVPLTCAERKVYLPSYSMYLIHAKGTKYNGMEMPDLWIATKCYKI